MNKIIISSNLLCITLRAVLRTMDDKPLTIMYAKGHSIFFGTNQFEIDCYFKSDFTIAVYRTAIVRFIKILDLLEDQPITVGFKDSERFNIWIKECIV